MRFYSLSYRDTLQLPIKAFWLMSNNINRISAEEDIRKLSIAASAASEDGFKGANEALRNEMGEVFKKPEEIAVRDGLDTLKQLSGRLSAKK